MKTAEKVKRCTCLPQRPDAPWHRADCPVCSEKVKHTKGPWRITYNTDEWADPTDPDDAEAIAERYVVGIEGANGQSVYYTESGYFKPRMEDVQLISAAPEMAEALKQIAADCGLAASVASLNNDTAHLNNYAEYQRIATAALTKAGLL